MTNAEFLDLVEQTRSAQRTYFATKTSEALSKARELERRLDQAIKQIRDRQPRLFQ